MTEPYKVDDVVRAFHPGMFGVVKEGKVAKVGSVYLYIDFGELLGGVKRVRYQHVVSKDDLQVAIDAGEAEGEVVGEHTEDISYKFD